MISLIQKRDVKFTMKFRYAVLKGDSTGDSKLFYYPLTLQKLALFLHEAYKESKKHVSEKPMLVAMQNPDLGVYICVGVLGSSRISDTEKK